MGRAFRLEKLGAAALLATAALACTYGPRTDEPLVFGGTLVDNNFNPFQNANPNTLSVDPSVRRGGTSSLKISVPIPAFGYAGGAFVANSARDLSAYNALTFWAKSDYPTASFAQLGVGNDNSGNSKYPAAISNVAVGTDWQKIVIPIPLPAKLSFERGLFFFSAAAQAGAGYNIWLDELQFEILDATVLGAPVPHIGTKTLNLSVGAPAVSVNSITATDDKGNATYFDVIDFPVTLLSGGALATNTVQVTVPPGYLTFAAAPANQVVVDPLGLVTAVGAVDAMTGQPADHGTATVTATLSGAGPKGALADVPSPDLVTVNVNVPAVPTGAATPPPPPRPADTVLSLLSSVYVNSPVDTWGTSWSNDPCGCVGPHLSELFLGGDAVKEYSSLLYVGVDFSGHQLDLTAMTHVHLDVWTPDASKFGVKLVDWPGGAYNPQTVKQAEVAAPGLVKKKWVAIDLALSSFTGGGLSSRDHTAQLILTSSGTATVYVDNVYFYK